MQKIEKLMIYRFCFNRNDKTKNFELIGNIIPEYCKIIPYQNQDGELAIKVNIAVEATAEKHKCKINIFETCEINIFETAANQTGLCLEDVLFYELFYNNVDGLIEEWHIFVSEIEE